MPAENWVGSWVYSPVYTKKIGWTSGPEWRPLLFQTSFTASIPLLHSMVLLPLPSYSVLLPTLYPFSTALQNIRTWVSNPLKTMHFQCHWYLIPTVFNAHLCPHNFPHSVLALCLPCFALFQPWRPCFLFCTSYMLGDWSPHKPPKGATCLCSANFLTC